MTNTISQKNLDSQKISNFRDILDVLVSDNSLMKAQADHIRAESKAMGKQDIEILEESGLVPTDRLLKAYSEFYNLPIIKLKGYYIPKSIIIKIPKKVALKYHIVPFDQKEGILRVAVSKPSLLQADKPGILARLKKKQKAEVDLFITPEADFNEALKYYDLKEQKAEKPQPKLIPENEKPENQKIEMGQKENQQKINTEDLPRILDVLIHQNLLKPEDAFEIYQKSQKDKKTPEAVLREEGHVPADDVAKAEAQIYNLPYISLKELDITPDIIKNFPKNISEDYRIVVFDTISDKAFKIATSQPENPKVREILQFLKNQNGIDGLLYITTPKDIDEALKKYDEVNMPYSASLQPDKTNIAETKETPEMREEEVGELDIGTLIKKDITTPEELQEIAKSEEVPKLLAAIINFALVKKASDIHIEPWKEKLHVRYRIDGVLKDILQVDRKLHPAILARIKISARLRIDEQRIPQDGRFDVSFKEHQVDIRVSTLPTSNGEKAVLRLLDKAKGVITLEELGLKGKDFEIISKDIKKPYGMILATGPTGSGKTTTLYAILQSINTSTTNIVTLEDPIEYEIDGVNHCQARPDIGFSFAEGLRSILRQDPNVIMIGEIRDKETAAMSVHASLTGHLVLSSLHTNDAVGAIPRLIDMGIEPFLIASSLSAVIAQRLVRKICPKCKQKISLAPEIIERIKEELAKIPKSANIQIPQQFQFYRGKGCSECEDGYVGRLGVFEVLPVTTEIQKLTIKRASASEVREVAISEGMITMKQDGILKALEGITTIDEVFRVTLIQ